MKINNLLETVLIFIFSILLLNGCRTESNIDENKNIQTNIPQKKLRLKDVPELKNILTSNPKLFNKRVKFSINDSIEVFNINSKKLNSYSVQINPDNDSAFYIVTLSYDKLKNNKVSKLIGKFVPDNNTFEKNIKNFSGKSYFETITGTPIVNSIWKNGKVIDNKNIRNAKTASCTTQSYIVANMCSEDVHWPWEGGCQASGKAYFSISTSMNCDQEMIDPNWGGGGFGDSGGGGSNSIATMSSPDAINYLLAQIGMTSLNTQQYNFLASYPIIADYFKTYFWGDNQNIDGANFMNWGINFFMQNPNTTIEQFQNWFVEGQLDYTNAEEVMFASNLSKVMNDINTYQANDTLSQLNTNWPNWNKITETMKTLVKTSAPLAVKFGKVLFKTLSPLNQNDYSRNFINGHIDAMRYSIDALGVINYNTNTMQWKDIVLCWLFELGNFPINNSTGLGTMPTLGFSGTDYVISGNPNNNMRHLSNHKLVNGIPDKNSIMFLRNIVIERIKQNNLSTVNGEWVFGTDATVDTIIKQDMMQFCLGSYNTDVYIRALGNSQYELTFIVKNKTGWQSGTRGLNDYNNDPTNDSSLGDKPRGVGIHLGGTIGETFGWKETITVR